MAELTVVGFNSRPWVPLITEAIEAADMIPAVFDNPNAALHALEAEKPFALVSSLGLTPNTGYLARSLIWAASRASVPTAIFSGVDSRVADKLIGVEYSRFIPIATEDRNWQPDKELTKWLMGLVSVGEPQDQQ